ncbi:MAG TPA: outer membrane protein assembly factor BamA [Candidatus Polarisedimenticolaceae bacterium]|nr:outer membrane protein assembly factor BamA [Candidatus Polarisedimenticolaceae bacterium]
MTVRLGAWASTAPRARVAASYLLLSCFSFVSPVSAEPGTIEQIIPQGLTRMQERAFLHALGLEVGEPYTEAKVLRQFKALWDGGWFSDIVFETETGPAGGVVLVIKVEERPVLSTVTYEENSVATRTAIEDRLRERNVTLKIGRPIDLGQVYYAETAIRDLLAEKGHLNAQVEAKINKVTETSRAVHFLITSGGKTRIKKIEFTGNAVFKDGKLADQLQLTSERKWYWPWSAKSLYHPVKWDQDAGNIRQLYLNNGYLDVEIRAPIVEIVQQGKERGRAAEEQQPDSAADAADEMAKAAAAETELPVKEQRRLQNKRRKAEKKRRKQEQKAANVKQQVYLTVPVIEGQQYTLGEVNISGNDELPVELVRALIPLREGEILRNDLLDGGIDRITRVYEDRGRLYANVVRQIERREGETVADVEVVIDEDKPYYVGRIEFVGNTSTRDNVLRREVLLDEGDLFSRTALDVSARKLNQLGYWQAIQEPIVEPIEGENRVDVTIPGQEAGRNEIQVGGGYSGVDGPFFNGVYSTRNFLGRGQTVSLALQVGGRSSRYQLSFQEPWLFNKPYTFGFSIFRTGTDYGSSLTSQSTGFSVLLGKRVGRYSNVNLNYRWQNVSSTTIPLGSTIQPRTITTETTISSVTPIYRFSTINNPYRPTRGRDFNASFQLAGGPLGGDASFLKPILTVTNYTKALGKTFFAMHLQAGVIREFGGGSTLSGSNVQGVPRFERFWLGGDTLGPRVFETRSITPLRYVRLDGNNNIIDVTDDVVGQPADDFADNGAGIPVLIEAGGDRFYLFQTELVFPVNEQIEVATFFDLGDALFEDQSLGFETARASAGIELRFHLPIFPVPLRLIYGIPVRKFERDRTSNFTFSIGRSF